MRRLLVGYRAAWATGMSNPGLPAAYCWSCGRPADVRDLEPLARLGMCSWCATCSERPRAEAREAALRATAPTGPVEA